MKKILIQLLVSSIIISLLAGLYFKNTWQSKVDSIIAVEDFDKNLDLKGWTNIKVTSPETGVSHYYYHLPGPTRWSPRILFLHGMSLDGKTFLHYQTLTNYYNLFAYNFPETSSSYKGQVDDFVDLVDDFIRTVNLRKLHLGGVSFGGIVGTKLLLKAQTHTNYQIRNFYLISSSIGDREEDGNFHSNIDKTRLARLPDFILYFILDYYQDKALDQDTKFPGHGLKDVLRIKELDFYRQVLLSVNHNHIYPEQTMEISNRVLLIHGSEDSIIPPNYALPTTNYFPKLKVKMISNANHSLAYKRGELMSEIIYRFNYYKNLESKSNFLISQPLN